VYQIQAFNVQSLKRQYIFTTVSARCRGTVNAGGRQVKRELNAFILVAVRNYRANLQWRPKTSILRTLCVCCRIKLLAHACQWAVASRLLTGLFD